MKLAKVSWPHRQHRNRDEARRRAARGLTGATFATRKSPTRSRPQSVIRRAGRLPSRLSNVVDRAAANGPWRHFVHHIRISTDGEINVAVKSGGLVCRRPISDFWKACAYGRPVAGVPDGD